MVDQGVPPSRAGLAPLGLFAGPDLKRPAASAARIIVGIAAFFLIVEFVTRLELVPPVYLPRASTVVWRMIELLQDPKFLRNVAATLYAWSVGLALAVLIS